MFNQVHIKLFLLGILFSFFGIAQDSIKILKPIPIKSPNQTPFLFVNLGAPRFILGDEQLNNLGVRDAGDAMKFIPGVQLRDYGGIGGIKTVSYRSLGSTHTGVLLDNNAQINQQIGSINLSSFESFALESVEFNSGQPQNYTAPASSYVPANTIQIRSKIMTPDTALSVGLYQNVTTVNAFESGLLVSSNLGEKGFIGGQIFSKYGTGRYKYTYDLSGSDEEFTRSNSEILNYKARLVGGCRWNKAHLTASVYYNKNDQQLPGAVVLFNSSNDQSLQNEDLRADVNYLLFIKKKWLLSGQINSNFSDTKYEDPTYLNFEGFINSLYRQQNHRTGIMLSRFLKHSTDRIFAGIDGSVGTLNSSEFDNSPQRIRYNSVIGVKYAFEKLSFETNLVHQLLFDNARTADSLTQTNFSKFSPYASVVWRPFKNKQMAFRSSYKHTFRMPSFNDLYYNFIGNSQLKPENAHLMNVGFTSKYKGLGNRSGSVKGGELFFTVDAFYNLVENKIVAIPTKDLFNWSMQNIGKTAAFGTELAFNYSKTKLEWTYAYAGSFSMNYAVDKTDVTSPSYNHQIPYTPLLTASATAVVGFKGYKLSNNLLFSGARYSLNENIPINYLAPYFDWNIGVDKEFSFKHHQTLGISLKAMNVLNNNYEVIRSFPMPGRYYQLTLRYNFK